MNDDRHLPRRKVVGMAIASGLTLLTAPLRSIAQQVTRRTPAQILGPYYPVIKPTDQDTDLTMIAGRTGRAHGQMIYVTGRVINRHGQPVTAAQMEIWQANSRGRYTHQSDQYDAPLDQNFEGYAQFATGDDGRYRIKTIKPGAYPDNSGKLRAPTVDSSI
jgi:protocatechuate 3,4-dioxygenase, beta subunit